MPRIRARRELCDCLDCNSDLPQQVDPTLRSALARLEPPPKSFVIIIDGALIANASGATSLQLSQVPHLGSLAKEGCTGLLAATVGEKIPSLACQILQGSATDAPLPPLPQRFKNIQVALIGNNSESIETIGKSAACHSIRVVPLNAPQKWPQVQNLASELTRELGVQSLEDYVASFSLGKPLEDTEQDMVILWMQLPEVVDHHHPRHDCLANEQVNGQNEVKVKEESSDTLDQACIALEWTDSLLRCLDSTPGFRDTVLTTVVVTPPPPPSPTDNDSNNRDSDMASILKRPLAQEQVPLTSVSAHTGGGSGEKVVLHRPLQSYQFQGMNQVAVDANHPAVVVHRLPGIIRKDRIEELSVAAIEAKGGGGCILAERMLYEIAYKIDKAPKYGA